MVCRPQLPLYAACVASVSNRVIARKLEREQKNKKVERGEGGEKRKCLPANPTILEKAPWYLTVRFICKLTARQNRIITNRLPLNQICKITFHSRVFITYIRLGTPYGDLICVLVTIHLRFFVLYNLRLCTNVMNASLVITLECPVLGRVVDKWSRITRSFGYPSLSQPRDRQVGESTAGMPSIGLSNTLNCSVPRRGISGLLRGWLFPFPTISLVSFAL